LRENGFEPPVGVVADPAVHLDDRVDGEKQQGRRPPDDRDERVVPGAPEALEVHAHLGHRKERVDHEPGQRDEECREGREAEGPARDPKPLLVEHGEHWHAKQRVSGGAVGLDAAARRAPHKGRAHVAQRERGDGRSGKEDRFREEDAQGDPVEPAPTQERGLAVEVPEG